MARLTKQLEIINYKKINKMDCQCHSRVQSQSRNGFGSFLCGDGAEINKKKHKKNGKNNRGWGKIRHFVGVGKNKEERENI